MSKEGANEDFEIASNGPNITHYDSVVKEAMEDYLSAKKSSWHFLDRLQNTQSHLPHIE